MGDIDLAADAGEEGDTHLALLLFLGCILLLCCLVLSWALHKLDWTVLPETTGFILFGVIFSIIAYAADESDRIVQFNAEIFFTVLLPPIIFVEGYSLRKRNFFRNFGVILLLAVVGTTICCFAFGLAFYGLIPEYSMIDALIFGALISAVDPVATCATYVNLGVQKQLYSIVSGESILNDAVAIVLFDTFVKIKDTGETGSAMVFAAVEDFFFICFLSMVIGLGIGLLSSLLLKATNGSPNKPQNSQYNTAVIIVMAYLSYLIGDLAGVSGIVAIFFCAISMGHYTRHVLSPDSQNESLSFFKTLASLAETFVFLFLGVSVFAYLDDYRIGHIVVCIVLCVVFRYIAVFGLLWPANLLRKHEISTKTKFAIAYSGLRGAIAFGLAMNVPHSPTRNNTITTTLAVVIFTVFVEGGTTGLMLNWLGGMFSEVDPLEPVEKKSSPRGFAAKFMYLDRKYLVPFFSLSRENRPKPLGASHHDPGMPDEVLLEGTAPSAMSTPAEELGPEAVRLSPYALYCEEGEEHSTHINNNVV